MRILNGHRLRLTLLIVAAALLALLPVSGRPTSLTAAEATALRAASTAHTPDPVRPGTASLRLTWANAEAHAGVPVGLTIDALDAEGRPQAARGDKLVLVLGDAQAEVRDAGPGGSPHAGGPSGSRQGVALALAAGTRRVEVTFHSPGHQMTTAILADEQTAGESTELVVQPVTLAIKGPTAATQGSATSYTLVATDAGGAPVDGYLGRVNLATDDPATEIAETGAAHGVPVVAHPFQAAEHGSATMSVRFAAPGTHQILARDPASLTVLASLSVNVAPANRLAAPAAGTSGSTSSGPPTPSVPIPSPTPLSPPAQPPGSAHSTGPTLSTPANSNLPVSGVEQLGQHIAPPPASPSSPADSGAGHVAQTGLMTISGRTSDFQYNTRTITASVGGGTACASTTQTYTQTYSLSLPASCGAAGQAISVSVAGAVAGLLTSGNGTCQQFALSTTVTGLTIETGGTPDASCGGSGTGTMTLAGRTSDFSYSARTISASVGSGTSCASTSQSGTSTFSLTLPASCGADGQAVFLSVVGAPAGLTLGTGATCLLFVRGTGVSGMTIQTGGTPNGTCAGSFQVQPSTTSTSTGVPLTLTVTALGSNGAVNTAYTGTIQFTGSDQAAQPSALTTYQFTAADAGVHRFTGVFNTAGSQTVTATDTETPAFQGTSLTVNVAETVLAASFAPGSVTQGTAASLTLAATDGNGHTITGYQGSVQLTSSFGSVAATAWGGGAQNGLYTFTVADSGQHVFAPVFSYAGSETAAAMDQANLASNATATTTVTSAPTSGYTHTAAPAGLTLGDGSTLWAVLDAQGRLLVRRNVGTLAEPAWRAPVLVRALNSSNVGAGHAEPGPARLDGRALLQLPRRHRHPSDLAQHFDRYGPNVAHAQPTDT